MEVNPTYLDTPIRYTTSDSCYSLILKTEGYDTKEISNYNRKIELKSLIFDANRLPNEVTTESTIGVINKLAENKKTEYEDIRDSVDLSITTNDLINYYESLKKAAEKINKIRKDPELIYILSQMKSILDQLQIYDEYYEDQIIDTYADITEETMEREKKLYLNRRDSSSIDV